MIFCQEGHLGVLAEGRGLPQSVCTFSEAFDSGPNSLSCAKAGVMDGKCLLARLIREAPTEGAGSQPGASLQLASLTFCHGQRECVKIPILRALESCL